MARLEALQAAVCRRLAPTMVEVALVIALNLLPAGVAALDAPLPPRRPEFPKGSVPHEKPSGEKLSLPAASESDVACMANLRSAAVTFETAEAPVGELDGCAINAPVRLTAVMVDKQRIALNAKPLLSCAFALEFSDFVKNLLAPLSAGTMGASLVAIDTGAGYECRGRNHANGAKLSAHAKGLALDVSALVFSDGKKIGIESQSDPQSTAYVKALRTAACGWFTTVLGPGADAHHDSHLHFDIEKHGSNGSYRICQ